MTAIVKRAWAVLATAFLLSQPARANIGDAWGFGSRTLALGGAGVAWGFDGYAAAENPAGLPRSASIRDDSVNRLTLSYGFIFMDPFFDPISGVVTQNSYIADGIVVGDVDTSYRATFGQELGLSYKLFPDFRNLTVGVTAFLPLSQLAYMDTGEAFQPEYFMYRDRTNRPQVEAGVGLDLGHGFSAGAGFFVGFSLTSNAEAFLQSDKTKPSTMRFSASLAPKASPTFGLLFTPPDDPGVFSLGVTARLALTSDNNLVLKSSARAFGNLTAALDFDFTASSALYYDPTTVRLGGTIRLRDHDRLSVQFDIQLWSAYVAPALQILNPNITSCGSQPCGVNISPGNNPAFQYQDTITPRVGYELDLGGTTLRFGYAYQPSILAGLSTGAGNYLDPPKHMFNLGAGWKFRHILAFETPCNLDVAFSYDLLPDQQITKTAGNEVGDTTDQKIGSPGYLAGGQIVGGGLSLSLPF
jgi:hypothetical protein